MKRFILTFCLICALSACSIKNTERTTVTTTDNQVKTKVVKIIETNIIKDGVDVFMGGVNWAWGVVKDGFAFFRSEE